MNKKVILFTLSVIILAEIICITGLCICKGQEDNQEQINNIQIREIPEQTVLYTIYRGTYYTIGNAISQLYALAEEKGIPVCGPVTTCYLNSPITEDISHRLIEIQIPVEDDAISQAGSLGIMTDVKRVPAMKVAVALKPKGYNNPTAVIQNLFTWINKKGYVVKGRMRQSILKSSKGHYNKLRTEFMIPIDELPDNYFFTLTMDPCYM